MAPKAAAATAHRPPEIVIDRSPALGFTDADAVWLDPAPVAPSVAPLVDWALLLPPVDLGDAVTDAWLPVESSAVGTAVAAAPVGKLVVAMLSQLPLGICPIGALGQ